MTRASRNCLNCAHFSRPETLAVGSTRLHHPYAPLVQREGILFLGRGRISRGGTGAKFYRPCRVGVGPRQAISSFIPMYNSLKLLRLPCGELNPTFQASTEHPRL